MSAAPARPSWLTAFVDVAAADHAAALAFWRDVTGYAVSPTRGEQDEFASLLPPGGADDHVKVQRLAGGPSRIHLDVHVADPRAAADAAVARGATEQPGPAEDLGYVTLASPGGLVFCFVSHPASTRAAPATWPGGSRSLLDQVCLDIPPAAYEQECEFWRATTDLELRPSSSHPAFRHLARPADQPIRLLLQRLDDEQPAVTAHLDLAVGDRPAETDRHLALGATDPAVHSFWTVLTDPAGLRYCLTDRDPDTGMVR